MSSICTVRLAGDRRGAHAHALLLVGGSFSLNETNAIFYFQRTLIQLFDVYVE